MTKGCGFVLGATLGCLVIIFLCILVVLVTLGLCRWILGG